MSSTDGPGAPSFGDLFEDPDAPVAAAPQLVPPATAQPVPPDSVGADPAVAAPVEAPEPEAEPQPAERSHLVAPLEPAVDVPADHEGPSDEPVTAEPADRPVVVAPAAPAGSGAPAAVVVAPAVAAPSPVARPWDGTVDPAVSSAPAPRVDTGRLYRSAGAEGPATLDAIPAIDPSRVPATAVAAERVEPAVVRSGDRGLTYSGVVVVVGAATVLVAFAEALLRHDIGWMTGLALLVSSVYSALVVRRADIWAAVVIPPLAFLVALLTAGQLTVLGETGGLMVREGALLFVSLATNAPWILGTTLLCLVIVLVRRHRARSA